MGGGHTSLELISGIMEVKEMTLLQEYFPIN